MPINEFKTKTPSFTHIRKKIINEFCPLNYSSERETKNQHRTIYQPNTKKLLDYDRIIAERKEILHANKYKRKRSKLTIRCNNMYQGELKTNLHNESECNIGNLWTSKNKRINI